MTFSSALLASVAIAGATQAGGCGNVSVIEKDVVIVGGGASGTYAAVRLREDYNKSIAVIETQDILVSRLAPQFSA
jgi:NADPH-dependent 2,4-dienoyl-CoA reductase/sulfur reductase-like enzyme